MQLYVKMAWPPLPIDLTNPSNFIPQSLITFMKMLLSGQSGQVSERVQTLTDSIGQDIVYAVSCAGVKTPKHVLLPFAVKSLTGCTELIKILNRISHRVSYTKTQEIDTALRLDKLAMQDEVGIPWRYSSVPQGIPPSGLCMG